MPVRLGRTGWFLPPRNGEGGPERSGGPGGVSNASEGRRTDAFLSPRGSPPTGLRPVPPPRSGEGLALRSKAPAFDDSEVRACGTTYPSPERGRGAVRASERNRPVACFERRAPKRKRRPGRWPERSGGPGGDGSRCVESMNIDFGRARDLHSSATNAPPSPLRKAGVHPSGQSATPAAGVDSGLRRNDEPRPELTRAVNLPLAGRSKSTNVDFGWGSDSRPNNPHPSPRRKPGSIRRDNPRPQRIPPPASHRRPSGGA